MENTHRSWRERVVDTLRLEEIGRREWKVVPILQKRLRHPYAYLENDMVSIIQRPDLHALNIHHKAATRASKSVPPSPQNPQTYRLSLNPSVLDGREIERGGVISAHV